MARSKFYWTHQHVGNELGDTQRQVLEIADRMGLKRDISTPSDITTNLSVSVPDDELADFTMELKSVGLVQIGSPASVVCENLVQRQAISVWVHDEVVVNPTPLDVWEMDKLDLFMHQRHQSLGRVLGERGFEESAVGGKVDGRYLAILDGEYSEAGGFREVVGYEYFVHACQRYYEIVDEHGDDGEWHLYDLDQGGMEVEYSVITVIHLHGICLVPRQA
jgi:hypothetical protein